MDAMTGVSFPAIVFLHIKDILEVVQIKNFGLNTKYILELIKLETFRA